MDPILLQKQIRDNAQDVQNYLMDLKQWEKEMGKKEERLKSESSDIKDKAGALIDREEEYKISQDYQGKESNVGIKRSRDEAYYEKEMGNKFVKQKKWKEALDCYSRAIEKYSLDAVFYANRALCHLKLNNPAAAETDCSVSLDLDGEYVKSYQRRATARIELKRYKEAKTDLLKALELEPSNTFIKGQLSVVEENLSRTEQEPEKSEDFIEAKSNEIFINPLSTTQNSGDKTHTLFPKGKLVLPIIKPTHMRSKKPLKRIEIKERTDDDDHKNVPLFTELNESVNSVSEMGNETTATNSEKHRGVVPNTHCEEQCALRYSENLMEGDSCSDIPSPPASSVQFITAWNALKNRPERRFEYLKQIPGDKLPTIFRESMESNILSEIIQILEREFLQHKVPVYPYLKGISEIKRFSALTMFLSKNDKSGLKSLLDSCIINNECTAEETAYLRGKYEL